MSADTPDCDCLQCALANLLMAWQTTRPETAPGDMMDDVAIILGGMIGEEYAAVKDEHRTAARISRVIAHMSHGAEHASGGGMLGAVAAVVRRGAAHARRPAGPEPALMSGALTPREAAALRAALIEARAFVADGLRSTLECVCVLDRETLEPIESTMDPEDNEHVERIRGVLARIDAALEEK